MSAAPACCVALTMCAAVGIDLAVASAGSADEAARDPDREMRRVEDKRPARALPMLNTLRDVGLALEICWRANEPPLAEARPGMTVTVMLTFNKAGELLGEPRFTYITPEAPPETKARYQRAVVAAIDSCTPLPFSPALGNALAGTPKIMPFVDRRNQKGI